MRDIEYANRMIKIEPTDEMMRAAARCQANKPRAKRVAINQVEIENQKGKIYQVLFATPCPGTLLAQCNCEAGLRGNVCYHLVAASLCPKWSKTDVLPSTFESRWEAAATAPMYHKTPAGDKYGAFDI